jgi:hypothetical protein
MIEMSGYIVCLSNPAYADCYYISVSAKKPNERADELYTEGVLWPFKIELAKQIPSMDGKIVSLHKLLSRMGDRLTPDRDFFRIQFEVVQNVFDLIDGEAWVEAPVAAGPSLADKVGLLLKQDSPKANEFQLNKLKMNVAASLKGRFGEAVEPTLETVRETVDMLRRETVVPV